MLRYKKVIALILTMLNLSTYSSNFIKAKQESNGLNRPKDVSYILPVTVIPSLVLVSSFVIYKLKGNNSSPSELPDINKYDASYLWSMAARHWKQVANTEKKFSAEYYEWMGHSYKCQAFARKADSKILNKNLNLAVEYYKLSSKEYIKRVKKNKDINNAKAHEMSALAAELGAAIGLNNWNNAENMWKELENTKTSYINYGLAKAQECHARYVQQKDSWNEASRIWKNIQNDTDLIESFGGEKSPYWVAYKEYAKARERFCKYLSKDFEFSVESLAKSWIEVARKDRETNSAILQGFNLEALAKATMLTENFRFSGSIKNNLENLIILL